jgi:hypothetical protein
VGTIHTTTPCNIVIMDHLNYQKLFYFSWNNGGPKFVGD